MKERLKESLIALIAMPFIIILTILSPIIALVWPGLLKPLMTTSDTGDEK